MNYEDMSDFDINRKVAAALGVEMGMVQSSNNKFGTVNLLNGRIFNPCNNPSDAWPIIVESEITVITGADCDGDYQAAFLDGYFEQLAIESNDEIHASFKFSAFSKSPLRAAMICFLKMKDAESKPCKKALADGQWYKFCGEFDMDSAPALCVNCGGKFKLKDAEK